LIYVFMFNIALLLLPAFLWIKGTNATARDIVEYNNRCEWVKVMHGINMTHPAGYEYYLSILELYADWGVDFIKADDMSRPYRVDEVHALNRAMQESGRDMVISLSPGAATITQNNVMKVTLRPHASVTGENFRREGFVMASA
jgi:hypothetical protein